MTLIDNIQSAIDSRALPFPIHATQGAGRFITLSVHIRAKDGRESAESVSFPTPVDAVLLDGLDRAVSRMVTMGNSAQHMGMEVF